MQMIIFRNHIILNYFGKEEERFLMKSKKALILYIKQKLEYLANFNLKLKKIESSFYNFKMIEESILILFWILMKKKSIIKIIF